MFLMTRQNVPINSLVLSVEKPQKFTASVSQLTHHFSRNRNCFYCLHERVAPLTFSAKFFCALLSIKCSLVRPSHVITIIFNNAVSSNNLLCDVRFVSNLPQKMRSFHYHLYQHLNNLKQKKRFFPIKENSFLKSIESQHVFRIFLSFEFHLFPIWYSKTGCHLQQWGKKLLDIFFDCCSCSIAPHSKAWPQEPKAITESFKSR